MSENAIGRLMKKAADLGAADVRVVLVSQIPVQDDIVELCMPPQCDGYGQSANCPPHSMTPAEFRELLTGYDCAVVFKVEAPMEILLSDEKDSVGRLVQETAAALEKFAIELGYPASRALAGDCCKRLFCNDHERCNVIYGGGECRNPEKARTSMSGLGVNFNRLNRVLGWQASGETDEGAGAMGMMVGMVLVG